MFDSYYLKVNVRNVWKWMFGSCYLKVNVQNVWKWMFGSYYLKVDVWLILFESGCFEMFESGCLARVIWKWMFEMFERTNWNWKSWPQSAICFWSHVYRILRIWQISSNIQHILLYNAKIFVVMWSKRCKIHESRVCLSGASAYQQVHFQRIQRIKVHGCFLHPDKVKLLCLRNR